MSLAYFNLHIYVKIYLWALPRLAASEEAVKGWRDS